MEVTGDPGAYAFEFGKAIGAGFFECGLGTFAFGNVAGDAGEIAFAFCLKFSER